MHSHFSVWKAPSIFSFAAILFLAADAGAQGPPVIHPNGVVNAASFRPADFPQAELAPGALVSIFGRDLGPQEGVQARQFPLPEELGPLRTRVRVNDQQMCRLLYVSDTQINCQLPFGLAGNRVRLRVVTSAGQSGDVEAPFGPNGAGLFTQARNGRGPLLAQNFQDGPDPQNRFRMNGARNPARPGQIMVLWGTGLGETDPPVAAGQPATGQTIAVDQPEIFVGGVRAEIQYAGRAPGFAGLDQIQIVIPPDAEEGCSVPIRLRQRDRDSNIGTVSISRNEGRCSDAYTAVAPGESFGQVVLASGLGRLGPAQLGPMSRFGGPYPPSPSPFNPPGANVGPGGGVRSGVGGVGSNGIGPYGLHPGIPPFAGGVMSATGPGPGGPGGMPGPGMPAVGPNMALAQFVLLGEDADLDIGVPPAATNSCNSYPLQPYGVLDIVRGPVERLDAGDLTITGPGLNLTLSPIDTANGPVYMQAMPTPLEQGDYDAGGLGGSEVGAFGPVSLTVPPLVTVSTSLAPGALVRRSQALTIDWTGGAPSDLVLIHGRVFAIPPGTPRPIREPMSLRSQAFVCSTTAGAMSFTVPSYILQLLPDGLLTLNVTHMPSSEDVSRFEADGLELGGVFRWLDTTTFLDLELVP